MPRAIQCVGGVNSNGKCAHGQRRLIVRQRRPRCSAVRRLPNPSLRRANENSVACGIGWIDGDCRDSARGVAEWRSPGQRGRWPNGAPGTGEWRERPQALARLIRAGSRSLVERPAPLPREAIHGEDEKQQQRAGIFKELRQLKVSPSGFLKNMISALFMRIHVGRHRRSLERKGRVLGGIPPGRMGVPRVEGESSTNTVYLQWNRINS